MKALGVVVARRGPTGTISYPELWAEPPLAFRPTPDGLFVAAAAAGPLGGDEVCIRIRVEAGASLRLTTVGATIALAGQPALPSTWRWDITLEAGARLAFDPEPTVVADGAWHVSEIDVAVAADAELRLREQVLLGRHGEAGGRWQGRLQVVRDGDEIIRQEHDTRGDSAVDAGPYGRGGSTAFGSWLHIGYGAGGSAVGVGWARMQLATPDAVLGVAVAQDAPTLRARLDDAAHDPR
jgi:urease accessory protein